MNEETLTTDAQPEPTQSIEQLTQQNNRLIAEISALNNRAEDLEISLEIANDRWVAVVNELARTELQLRKLRKAQ